MNIIYECPVEFCSFVVLVWHLPMISNYKELCSFSVTDIFISTSFIRLQHKELVGLLFTYQDLSHHEVHVRYLQVLSVHKVDNRIPSGHIDDQVSDHILPSRTLIVTCVFESVCSIILVVLLYISFFMYLLPKSRSRDTWWVSTFELHKIPCSSF